jgi:sterol desaturase/sphingolipid hydroxylase (fatty acid hydroxylase superfamily)
VIAVGAIALALLDLWHYVFHVLAHKTPVLWRFHVMHHNTDHLEATAAMRFHLAEVGVQCALSLPVYALLGVSIYEVLAYQVVLLPVSMFHHADLRLPGRVERVLRVFIVTPGMHLLHHSTWERETDSNYSAVLSVWDRVFGSYRWRDDLESVEVGIEGYGKEETATLRGMLRTGLEQPEHAPGRAPAPGKLPRELRKRDRLRALRAR